MELDEQHILEALRNGRQIDFEKMFKAWYSPLCNYAFGFLASRDDAEETVQNVFIQLWSKRKEIEIESSLRSYLFRAVRNSCLNVLKHEKVKKEYSAYAMSGPTATVAGGDDIMSAEELRIRISNALEILPTECRRVFELSRFEELKYAEIANKLGISIKTVENQMGKALRIMREELKDYLPIIFIVLQDFI